jgi:hypothetical protein
MRPAKAGSHGDLGWGLARRHEMGSDEEAKGGTLLDCGDYSGGKLGASLLGPSIL